MALLHPTDPPMAYPSALRGEYLIRNPTANFLMILMDQMLKVLKCLSAKNPPILSLKSLLLSNISQIGDVILSTSLLPILHQAFPGIHIGMIVGSWNEEVVKNHPLIQKLYFLDHWKVSRTNQSRFQKVKCYLKMRKTILQEIRQDRYDVAVDLCYYFPNTIPLLWQSGIPIRIGYPTGGFAPLLTHSIPWINKPQSTAQYFLDLFMSLLPNPIPSDLHPILPSIDEKIYKRAQKKIGWDPIRKYLVVHMGSGNPIKEWPLDKWRELAFRLYNHLLIFTGKGEKECAAIDYVTSNLPHCVSACNQLTWKELSALLSHAELLLSVDTGVGHAAAAYGIPQVQLYCGINPIEHWSPLTSNKIILMKRLPCYPCYRMNGCNTMACIKEVEVEEVVQSVNRLLKKASTELAANHSIIGEHIESSYTQFHKE